MSMRRAGSWTVAVLATTLPLLLILCSTLWTSPYPLSEAVGLFEDVAERRVSEFFDPTLSHYRPAFYVVLSAIYAYNSASTMANVLFAEPTEGLFRLVRALTRGALQPWHMVYVLSSAATTALIAFWGVSAMVHARDRKWSVESRLFVATIVAIAACGALSFNYSRDRLGGMAVVFYALAAFFAVRLAAARAARASWPLATVAGVALLVLAAAWQCRAIYTMEFTRQRAVNSHREWITDLARRRAEFATRATYLRIMEDMTDQGTSRIPIQRTRYPRWMLDPNP